jgi:hypothetical protein
MEDGRIVNLEETVAKLQAQGADIQTTLKLLMASITQLLANYATPDTPARGKNVGNGPAQKPHRPSGRTARL